MTAGMSLLLHAAARVAWTSWSIHPSTVIGLGALGGLYLWAGARVGRPSALQQGRFFAGLLVLFVSLNGPVHDLSDYYLFSGHMVQHLLLTLVAPPLLVSGVTGAMLRPALRRRGIAGAARFLT